MDEDATPLASSTTAQSSSDMPDECVHRRVRWVINELEALLQRDCVPPRTVSQGESAGRAGIYDTISCMKATSCLNPYKDALGNYCAAYENLHEPEMDALNAAVAVKNSYVVIWAALRQMQEHTATLLACRMREIEALNVVLRAEQLCRDRATVTVERARQYIVSLERDVAMLQEQNVIKQKAATDSLRAPPKFLEAQSSKEPTAFSAAGGPDRQVEAPDIGEKARCRRQEMEEREKLLRDGYGAMFSFVEGLKKSGPWPPPVQLNTEWKNTLATYVASFADEVGHFQRDLQGWLDKNIEEGTEDAALLEEAPSVTDEMWTAEGEVEKESGAAEGKVEETEKVMTEEMWVMKGEVEGMEKVVMEETWRAQEGPLDVHRAAGVEPSQPLDVAPVMETNRETRSSPCATFPPLDGYADDADGMLPSIGSPISDGYANDGASEFCGVGSPTSDVHTDDGAEVLSGAGIPSLDVQVDGGAGEMFSVENPTLDGYADDRAGMLPGVGSPTSDVQTDVGAGVLSGAGSPTLDGDADGRAGMLPGVGNHTSDVQTDVGARVLSGAGSPSLDVHADGGAGVMSSVESPTLDGYADDMAGMLPGVGSPTSYVQTDADAGVLSRVGIRPSDAQADDEARVLSSVEIPNLDVQANDGAGALFRDGNLTFDGYADDGARVLSCIGSPTSDGYANDEASKLSRGGSPTSDVQTDAGAGVLSCVGSPNSGVQADDEAGVSGASSHESPLWERHFYESSNTTELWSLWCSRHPILPSHLSSLRPPSARRASGSKLNEPSILPSHLSSLRPPSARRASG